MIQELLYTSAPRGLKPGSRGFCTVLCTSGIPAPVATALESLSGYRPVFSPGDPQAELNPVVYSHLRLPLAGRRCDVISRVADYGLDYSQRTNKIAHHLVVDADNRPDAGPAWLMRQPGVMRTQWEGEPRLVSGDRQLPQANVSAKVCSTWKKLAGDAGWAGVLAEAFLKKPETPAYIVVSPGMDVLTLIEEALSLLPPHRRWDVTFSTYFTKIPNGATCQWRCVLADSPEANESRRYVQSLRIDLTTPLPPASGGELVETARTGRVASSTVGESAEVPNLPLRNSEAFERIEIAGGVPKGIAGPPRVQRFSTPGVRTPRLSRPSQWQWPLTVGLVGVATAVALAVTYTPSSSRTTAPAATSKVAETQMTVTPSMPRAPTEVQIKLDKNAIDENSPPGTPVGSLIVISDENHNQSIPGLLELVGDSPDNKLFEIRNAELIAKSVLDFEKQSSYQVQIQVSGEGILTRADQFTINVTDMNDPPISVQLSAQTIPDRAPAGHVVGVLSTTDPDVGVHKSEQFQYSIVEDAKSETAGLLKVDGNKLVAAREINIHKTAGGIVPIQIRSADSSGLTLEAAQSFEIKVSPTILRWPRVLYLSEKQVTVGNGMAEAIDLDGRPSLLFELHSYGSVRSTLKRLSNQSRVQLFNEISGDPQLIFEVRVTPDSVTGRSHPQAVLNVGTVPWSEISPFFAVIRDDHAKQNSYLIFSEPPSISEGGDGLSVGSFGEQFSKPADFIAHLQKLRTVHVAFVGGSEGSQVSETDGQPQAELKASSLEKVEYRCSFNPVHILRLRELVDTKFLGMDLPSPDISAWIKEKNAVRLSLVDFSSDYRKFRIQASAKEDLRTNLLNAITKLAVEIIDVRFTLKPVKTESGAGASASSPAKAEKERKWSEKYSQASDLERLVGDIKAKIKDKEFADSTPNPAEIAEIEGLIEKLSLLSAELDNISVVELVLAWPLSEVAKSEAVPLIVYPGDLKIPSDGKSSGGRN